MMIASAPRWTKCANSARKQASPMLKAAEARSARADAINSGGCLTRRRQVSTIRLSVNRLPRRRLS